MRRGGCGSRPASARRRVGASIGVYGRNSRALAPKGRVCARRVRSVWPMFAVWVRDPQPRRRERCLCTSLHARPPSVAPQPGHGASKLSRPETRGPIFMGARPCKIPSNCAERHLATGSSRELGAGRNTALPARGLHGCLPIAWRPHLPSEAGVVCLARTTCAGERRLLHRKQSSVASRRKRIAAWNAAREIARELTARSGAVPTTPCAQQRTQSSSSRCALPLGASPPRSFANFTSQCR